MKHCVLSITVFVLGIAGCVEKHIEPEFRNTNWGITIDQVKILESARLVMDNGKMLSYEGRVAGLPCQIVYNFVKNQLTESHYFFKPQHSTDNAFVQDYDTLKHSISEKYGTPTLDDATWKDDTYKGIPAKVGLAVRSGHLSLVTKWETPSTDVWLFLVGENSHMNLSMKYASRQLARVQEEEKAESLPDPKPNEF